MTIGQKIASTLVGDEDLGVRGRSLYFVACLLVAFPISALFSAIIDRQPPVQYIEAYALKPEVQAGGQVEIRFDVNRSRICETISVTRIVRDEKGVDHAVLGYTLASTTRPGREVYDRIITVPETVPPGKAWYFIRLRYGCNFLNFFGWPIEVESPHVPLTVQPKTFTLGEFLPLKPLGGKRLVMLADALETPRGDRGPLIPRVYEEVALQLP